MLPHTPEEMHRRALAKARRLQKERAEHHRKARVALADGRLRVAAHHQREAAASHLKIEHSLQWAKGLRMLLDRKDPTP